MTHVQRQRIENQKIDCTIDFRNDNIYWKWADYFSSSVGVLLFLIQAINGIQEEEMLMAGALRKESSKKPCTIQLHYENSALIISDFGQKSDRYVYQRFQFRKQHLVKSMKAIGLLTKKLRSPRNWS